jgi:hypothetical protein
VYTSRKGRTTAADSKMQCRKEHWLETRAMQLEDPKFDTTQIGTPAADWLVPDARAAIQEKAMTDEEYQSICKQLANGDNNVDLNYQLKNDILCLANRVYAPKGMQTRIMTSEHNSKIAQIFGRE